MVNYERQKETLYKMIKLYGKNRAQRNMGGHLKISNLHHCLPIMNVYCEQIITGKNCKQIKSRSCSKIG